MAGQTGRLSWRDSKSRSSAEMKNTRRLAVTVTCLLLVGVFVAIMWPRPSEKTIVAVLSIQSGQKLVTPPNLFAKQDQDRFLELDKLKSNYEAAAKWESQQESGSTGHIRDRLQQMQVGPRDTLILYVRAYGISFRDQALGEQALIVCSDFQSPSSNPGDKLLGTYPLTDLLDDLKSNKAGTKLLILDTGGLNYDPFLGIDDNRFAFLVEQELREHDDPALWVLLPHGPRETLGVSYAQRSSLAAKCLADGLSGWADSDQSDEISLDELYAYLRHHTRMWYPENSPTPILMKARADGSDAIVTRDDSPDEVKLASVWDDPPDRSRSDLDPLDETEGPDRKKGGGINASNIRSKVTDLKRARTKAKQAVTASPKSQARRALNKSLSEAEKEANDKRATPKEDSQTDPESVAGTNDTGAAAANAEGASAAPRNDLPAELVQLHGALDAAWSARDSLHDRTNGRRLSPVDFAPHLWREVNALLVDYERQCCGDPDTKLPTKIKQLTSDLQRLAQAIDGLEKVKPGDSLEASNLFAAWNDFVEQKDRFKMFMEPTRGSQATADAVRELNDTLFAAPYYIQWYTVSGLHPGQRDRVETAAEIKRLLNAMSQLLLGLDDSGFRDNLEEDLASVRRPLTQRLLSEAETARSLASQPIGLRRIEELLGTPLLKAPQRRRLLNELLRRDRLPPHPEKYPRTPDFGSLANQRSVPDVDQLLRDFISTCDPAFKPTDTPDPRYYRRLQNSIAGEPAVAGTRRVWLLDPRQLTGTRLRGFPPDLAIDVAPQPRAMTLICEEQSKRLSQKEFRTYVLTVTTTSIQTSAVTATLSFDDELISVRRAGEEVLGKHKQEIRFPPGDGRAQLKFEIKAKRDNQNQKAAVIAFVARAGGLQTNESVVCPLPNPNRIRLLVESKTTTRPQSTLAGDPVMRPFPNRDTKFQFKLWNESNEEKEVEIHLIAIPPDRRRAWAPGMFSDVDTLKREMFEDDADGDRVELRAEFAKYSLAKTKLTLAPNATSGFVNFSPASAPAEGGGDSAKAAPKAAPDPKDPAPKNAVTINDGMVCVIKNVNDDQESWIEGIGIDPWAPADYIAFAKEPYYDNVNDITCSLRLKHDIDGDEQPDAVPGLAAQPVMVEWNPADVLGPQAVGVFNGMLLRDEDVIQILGAAPPDSEPRRIYLSVDGYPRAFGYSVECKRKGLVEDLRDDQQVKLLRLSRPDGKPADFIAPAERKWFFKAPCETIFAEFQVDAPANAFKKPGDVIALKIGADPPLSFYRDRQIETTLQLAGDTLTLHAKISDYRFVYPLGKKLNKRIPVTLGLRYESKQRTDQAVLQVDSELPAINQFQINAVGGRRDGSTVLVVPHGQPILASAEPADEFSGVKQVDVWIDLDGNNELDEGEPKKSRRADLGDNWVVNLETKDLAIDKVYQIIARTTDRVGNVSRYNARNHSARFKIAMTAPSKPKKGAIKGVVKKGKLLAPGITVTLAELNITTKTGDDGKFTFPDIPLGRPFTLEAEGAVQGTLRQGKLEGVEASPLDKPKKWEIEMKPIPKKD